MKKALTLLLGASLLLANVAANAGTVIEDSAITAEIKAKMVANSLVSASDITVETNKGMAKLSGMVNTPAEADSAIEIASSVKGVTDVDVTDLHVHGGKHPIADSVITAKVKGSYVREKVFGDDAISLTNIHVTTNNGIVELTGTATKAQADNAERLAKLVTGVKEVKSGLKIKD